MGGRGRPRKGFKKSGSVKKSVANEGSSLVLKTESTPKTAVSKDALTPNSKSKYYKFHNEKRKRTSGETDFSRRLFGGGTDAPVKMGAKIKL